MLVEDETALALGLGKMVRGWLAFDERVLQHTLKGLARDVAGRKGALKCLWGVTAHRADSGTLQRAAVEQPPGYRVGAAPLDPFLAKVALAAGEQPQIGAHSRSVMSHKAFEPAIVVA